MVLSMSFLTGIWKVVAVPPLLSTGLKVCVAAVVAGSKVLDLNIGAPDLAVVSLKRKLFFMWCLIHPGI